MSDVQVEAIDLVLFDVAGVEFAADLLQVRRIDSPDPDESVGEPLGHPHQGHRALVFAAQGQSERRLAVDKVLGVRRVPTHNLRRMPRVVAAPPMSIGAWVEGEKTIMLIDLHALVMP